MIPEHLPDEETLKKRREPKFVVDPKDVVPKDDVRVRQWALDIMQKHTSRLNDQVPNGKIVYEKEIEPEEIDIRNIYPFKDMYYMIFRKKPYWCLRLLYKTTGGNHAILAELTYANVDNI
ncbi:MAG: hypothetical protein ACXAC5_11785 [Promethearchaeota archaeon]|jgi:hypothetical protein